MYHSWLLCNSIVSLSVSMRDAPQTLYLDGENDVLTIADTSVGRNETRLSEFKNNFWILESAEKNHRNSSEFVPYIYILFYMI